MPRVLQEATRAWRIGRNIIINARHADFDGLTVGPETPVWWDRRLFRRA